jgi:Apea-like HEPN
VLLPNYLVGFKDGIRAITIGRVKAALTADISPELMKRLGTIEIIHGPTTSEDKITVKMPSGCWVVNVDAARDNAQEEAKWLLDVAISLLRMSYTSVGKMFPGVGDIEPHPWEPWNFQEAGLTMGPQVVYVGKRTTPSLYEVNKKLDAAICESSFIARAKLIFDPQKGTLAERVSRGLGWLTRGRQTHDRAERLLYNFTAIEALLSSDDKSAPVVQNIARGAAVILTNDVADRAKTAKDVRKLYELRSSIVHAGGRPIAWTHTNFAQNIAEDLFWRVLPSVDLSIKHSDFTDQLSFASYGSPWPPQKAAPDA